MDRDIQTIQSIDSVPHIMTMLADATGLRFICIARVTDKHWKSCSVLDQIEFNMKPGDELDIKTTLCDTVRASDAPVIIENASNDEVYSTNDIPVMYGFESYFSYPIYDHDGKFFGTICGLDPLPAKLKTPKIESLIESFATLISRQMKTDHRVNTLESDLASEQAGSSLREQYIAILGHDLRTPLSSVGMGIDYLKDVLTEETSLAVLGKMQSSTKRMSRLIRDVMDFTYGKMGNGIPLSLVSVSTLGDTLQDTVYELSQLHPECQVETDIDISGTFDCDPERISQLLSNLLINAIVHGDRSYPIRVEAGIREKKLTLSVANKGEPIAAQTKEKLFQPFSRSEHSANEKGLGLGLFIASQIARAHQGVLEVESDVNQTCFRFSATLKRLPTNG